jgi:hypothetical protein
MLVAGSEENYSEIAKYNEGFCLILPLKVESIVYTGCAVDFFMMLPLSRLYRVSQEEMSIFREVTVSVILSEKRVYMFICPIPNGFRDRAISLYTEQKSNTPCPHTSCKVH